MNVYKKLVKLARGRDLPVRLAEVAQAAATAPTAIAAYKAFLKLAPNDSLAPAAGRR